MTRFTAHELNDRRLLELHREVAIIIDEDPEAGVKKALKNVHKWLQSSPSPALEEWRSILSEKPWKAVRALITADTEEGRRLRQSTPFTGILPESTRQRILEKYRKLKNEQIST